MEFRIGDTRVRAQVLLDGGHETRTFPLVQSRGLVRYGGATPPLWDRQPQHVGPRDDGWCCRKGWEKHGAASNELALVHL